ncbi:hypothetical protein ATEIFO6365_0011018000 [Aspergillus terreus]|uniref:Uncharacterized protein n=1 Tax=Aspergillus terreus TaxID=33178 RepID=A0A5M3Z2W0_ASPTE|nr:hypothetical protein ATETN484_0006018000 [Aspergillus terreus]GFF19921.1 hypothetical protein ATEIFO6365_0011018000 [Aspergillus terreus]
MSMAPIALCATITGRKFSDSTPSLAVSRLNQLNAISARPGPPSICRLLSDDDSRTEPCRMPSRSALHRRLNGGTLTSYALGYDMVPAIDGHDPPDVYNNNIYQLSHSTTGISSLLFIMSDKENAQTPPHEEDPIKQEPSDDDQDQDQPEPEQAPQPQAQRRRRPRPPPYQQDSMDSNTALDRPRRQQRRQRRQPLGGDDGGPLGGLGGVNQAGDLVQNTAGNAVNGVTNTAGKAVGGLLGGNKGEEKEDGGRDEQLRLRLDLNLDIEVQLKAKIHGDLTLGLLN